MKESINCPSPASTRLDDILSGFGSKEDSVNTIEKPTRKVRVKKKRSFFSGFKKKDTAPKPKCAKGESVCVVGDTVKTLTVNCSGCIFGSDLSDSECRLSCANFAGELSFDKLILDNGFFKREYLQDDVLQLKELYNIAEGLRVSFPTECGACAQEHEAQLEKVRTAIKRDPKGLLNRGVEIKENEGMVVCGVEKKICSACEQKTESAVGQTFLKLQKNKLLEGYEFSPLVRPFFSNSKILFDIPDQNSIEMVYEVDGSKVVLSRGGEELYSLFPPEYFLSKQKLEIIKRTYEKVVGAGAKDEKTLSDFCKRELVSGSAKLGLEFSEGELSEMSKSMLRCMTGLDVIELLLKDSQLQDVYINSPIDSTPLYVKHDKFDECRTNIYLDEETARNIISKFRLKSGRSFSEVSPILDMELPEFGVRVNITGPPISPDGLAFAFRRASEEPWTLLRFIENKMISPLAAGMLSLMVSEESTILVCGDRGSGKTSMLSAMVGAMPTKYRILTMEDTFEIPVPALASKGGFRIQRMRIRPSTSANSYEVKADDAMRSLLRMGDSAIVMGEVRGEEARTLYEAMNVGGSGNCVLGSIHAKSPQSLLERVIFSLGVPPQSFKATDLIVMADRIRPKGGSHKLRRVVKIVEVGKDWNEPVSEKVFTTVMEYDRSLDLIVAGTALNNPSKSTILCKIAKRRGTDVNEVVEDINARADIFEHVVKLYKKYNDPALLSMENLVLINQKYSRLVDENIANFGYVNYSALAKDAIVWLDENTPAKKMIDISAKDGLRKSVQIST